MDVMISREYDATRRFETVLPCISTQSLENAAKSEAWHLTCSNDRVPMQPSVRQEFVSIRVSAEDASIPSAGSLARVAFRFVRDQIESISALGWLVQGKHRRPSLVREEDLW